MRDTPGQQQLKPTPPIAPVGKTDNRLFADPQHLLDDHGRVVQKRQRLAQDDIVETGRRIIGQPFFEVALTHAQTAPDAGQNPGLAQLDAPSSHLFLADEILQQGAVPTPQVKNTDLGGNHISDHQQVGTQADRVHGAAWGQNARNSRTLMRPPRSSALFDCGSADGTRGRRAERCPRRGPDGQENCRADWSWFRLRAETRRVPTNSARRDR